jgi:serine/threonine protein kinase/Tfp pilus assembly protein PilF
MNKVFEANTTISHYRIVRKIGAGGMGEVYLADDTKLDRKVALKILPPQFAEDTDRMSRFVREAKSASALNHPNIITIHEIGEFDGTHFIATEYIEGETLHKHLKGENFSLKSALDVAAQIVSALQTAHSANIIHRDVKPENVMIRADGLIKILDFGIAKLSAPPVVASGSSEDATAIKPHGTSPGMVIGTANYMSPEQAKGKKIDARSDIFSFGIVFYEMLTGRRAFEGETALESISSILKDEPKAISQILPGVPPEIERIVNKTLRKDRDERYQTAKDLLIDLKDARQSLELQHLLGRTISPDKAEPKTQILPATTADGISQTTTNQTVSSNPRTKYLVIGLLSLVLAVCGFFGYKYLSPTKQIETIAVMPFINESGNADVEYLSDGMTETLIKSLSQLPNLAVKSRSTVFYYKGKETSPKRIGEELNVQAVLLGRIVQRGDDLKLSLELVNTNTQDVIWSESYDRKQSDLIALQSEIARDVSTNLKAKLSGAEEIKVTKLATSDPEAYQAYLKGRYYWNRRTAENLKKAIEQFKAATDRDPNYALAYAGLADCYILLNQHAGTPVSVTIPQAKAYAERAIAIDDQLAEPHASLASVNEMLWQWAEAEREYKRAIELNPNYATGYQWYSNFLKNLGRLDEAAVMIKRAHEIDPLSSAISINLSRMYLLQNDPNASIENSLKVIELDPNFPSAYVHLGQAYLKQGRNAEAIANLEKAVELSNRAGETLMYLGHGYAVTGKRTQAIAIVKELEEKFARKEANGRYVAGVYAGLGEKDGAFEWLEKDFQAKGEVSSITWGIPHESLRDDPRYKDLMKRMGLPE